MKSSSGLASGHGPGAFTIIQAKHGLFQIDFRELWRYRDLILVLVKRDVKAEFSQTILGPVWFILHPIMQAVVFALIFGTFAKIPTDGAVPFLFYNASLVLWTYFTATTTLVSSSFITNASLFSKVYFPRLIVPVAGALFRMISLAVNFSIFIGFLLFFIWYGAKVQPNLWILAAPLLVLQTTTLALGVGTLASAFTTRYRDVVVAFNYVISFWLYVTPIIYPFSQVPERFKWLFYLNPMTSVVEVFRHAFLGTSTIDFNLWAVNAATTVVVFVVGIIAFNYTEKTVVDTI